MAPTILSALYRELGLKTLLAAPRDTKIMCISRFVRMFAYGGSTLILALFLSALEISDQRIGLFMTLTLLGDVVVSLILTMIADQIGRRNILILGAVLMSASGVFFAFGRWFWMLVFVSVLGVISPSGNEIGPFKAVEESVLAQLTDSNDRSDILAWYMLFGTAGTALGTLICGWMLQLLQKKFGFSELATYRLVFLVYAVLGLVKMWLSFLLSDKCETAETISTAQKGSQSQPGQRGEDHQLEGLLEEDDDEDDEAESSNARNSAAPSSTRSQQRGPVLTFILSLLPSVSAESRQLVFQLSFLFALDSLASGLVPASFLTYFFSTKFALATGVLGSIFFVTNLLSSMSSLAASSIARRIGLVKTMVFTHIPSAIALTLIPMPSTLAPAMIFLIIRSSIASMDQAPRQAFLAAAILPSERTSVMGVVNVVKTLSQSGGPVVTGWLAGKGKFWISFVAAGSMKISYDILMLYLFSGYTTREDKARQADADSAKPAYTVVADDDDEDDLEAGRDSR